MDSAFATGYRRPRERGCNPIPAFGVTCLPATCLNHWVYNKVGYFAYWIGLSIAWMGMALLMRPAAVMRSPASPLLPPRQCGDAACWPSTG